VTLDSQTNPNPLDPVVDGLNASQLMTSLGIKIFETKPMTETATDGEGRVDTGSLVIEWNFFGSGQYLILSLGGAGGHARAAPGFAKALVEGTVPEVPLEVTTPPSAGPVGSASAPVASSAGPVQSTRTPRAATRRPVQQALAVRASSGHFSTGVGAGLVALSVIGALLAGLGLRQVRIATLTCASGADACPHQWREL